MMNGGGGMSPNLTLNMVLDIAQQYKINMNCQVIFRKIWSVLLGFIMSSIRSMVLFG